MAPDNLKFAVVNREIIEIKRRIQLAEGQRKALFEEIEIERKKDTDEILNLKKEISKQVASLQQQKTNALKSRMPVVQLQEIIGHVGDKTSQEVLDILDLQIIDKNKQLDLLNYKLKQREINLKKLAKEYQEVLLRHSKNKIVPNKKHDEIRNKINAVEDKLREAEHVKCSYKDIKKALLEEGARFESKVATIKEEIKQQEYEIEKLKMINIEASKIRLAAKQALQQEEKQILQIAGEREQQASEGRNLVLERKQQLENLERHFYPSPKPPIVRNEADDESPKERRTPDNLSETPIQELNQIFETLKEATGGEDITDVLKKFQTQKSTQACLTELRETSETTKHKLEKQQENYSAELEKLKFVESKDLEHNAEEIEELGNNITKEIEKKNKIEENAAETTHLINLIYEKLQSIQFSFDKESSFEDSPLAILKNLNSIIKELILEGNLEARLNENMHELDINEDRYLPQPYEILRRTPVPQQRTPTPVTQPGGGSDEEDVPSRGFLKRQAQLVVDAKLKRKNLRFQLPRK